MKRKKPSVYAGLSELSEGSSPSAPAKNSATAFAVALFFVIGRNVLATRCGRRPACGACRGGLQPGGLRPGPTEAAAETSPMSTCAGFSHPFSPVRNRSHPLQHPKRTRLRLFSPETGCVLLFLSSFFLQNFPHLFVHFAI